MIPAHQEDRVARLDRTCRVDVVEGRVPAADEFVAVLFRRDQLIGRIEHLGQRVPGLGERPVSRHAPPVRIDEKGLVSGIDRRNRASGIDVHCIGKARHR